jgi:hypothetical protein
METEAAFLTESDLRAGAMAGLVATIIMGTVMTIFSPGFIEDEIAGLYAQSGNLLVGWIAHLVHGTVLGVVFSVFLADPGLFGLSRYRVKLLLAGAVFGLVLGVVAIGMILPIWLEQVGFPTPPDFPFVTGRMLAYQLLYGVVLGLLYPLSWKSLASDTDDESG